MFEVMGRYRGGIGDVMGSEWGGNRQETVGKNGCRRYRKCAHRTEEKARVYWGFGVFQRLKIVRKNLVKWGE